MIISKEEMSYILTQLRVKEVRFVHCSISEQVANVAVATLKNYQHPFLLVHLFDNKSGYDASHWMDPEWKERISREIFLLCWSNNFQVDCNLFMKELGPGGPRKYDKLYSFCSQGRVHFHELHTLHCRYTDKLWYAAIMAAVEYDKRHRCFSQEEGAPNMLYSLIREHPDNLKFV
jgi:hypothetical protein